MVAFVRAAIATAVIIICCAAVYSVAKSRGGSSNSYATLEGYVYPLRIQENSLNFGETYVKHTFPWSVRLENVTDSEVQISDFSTECSCLTVVPNSLTILPRAKADVSVVLNLSNASSNVTKGDRIAEYLVKMVPIDNMGRPLSKTANVRGRVKLPVTISKTALRFEGSNELIAGKVAIPQSIEITENEAVDDVRLEYDKKKLNVELEHSNKSRRHFLNVSPIVPVDEELFDASLLLEFDVNGRADTATFEIPIRGTITHDVEVIPSIVSHSAGDLSDRSDRLSLHSKVGQNFIVQDIEWVPDVVGSFTIKCTKAVTKGSDYDLTFVDVPSKAGIYTGQLNFDVEESDKLATAKGLSYSVTARVILVVDSN